MFGITLEKEMIMRNLLALALAAILSALLAGCGAGGPAGAAQAFLAAVQKGDAKAVANMYDYEATAKVANPGWDDIPPGQRLLIVQKVAEQQTPVIEGRMTQMQTLYKDAKVGTVTENGDEATVQLTGTGNPPALQMVKRADKWLVAGGQVQ